MIQTSFDDWTKVGPTSGRASSSPNLHRLLEELERRFGGMTNQGCFGARPIRGSTVTPSTHSWGAAIDIGYVPSADPVIAGEVVPWLVVRSAELGIDAIHDYRRCRIWRAGRTSDVGHACSLWWKAQRPSNATGMGAVWANHLHVETTRQAWDDDRPALDRWTE